MERRSPTRAQLRAAGMAALSAEPSDAGSATADSPPAAVRTDSPPDVAKSLQRISTSTVCFCMYVCVVPRK